MAIYAYDIEILPNCATFTFIKPTITNIEKYIQADISNNAEVKKAELIKMNAKVFIIFNETNNIEQLVKFIRSKDCGVLIGYNSIKYDDLMIDYIVNDYEKTFKYASTKDITTLLKDKSDAITSDHINKPYTLRKILDIPYNNYYTTVDLMSMHRLDKLMISLKQVSITLQWYRVEEYTPPPIIQDEADQFYDGKMDINLAWYDRYVIDEHLSNLLDYNINDVLITIRLHLTEIDEFKNRVATMHKYNIPVLSASRSSMADRILGKFYSEATGIPYYNFKDLRTNRSTIKFKDIIVPEISFQTKELQEFLVRLKAIVIKVNKNEFEEVLIFRGTGYTFAQGGLHSIDRGEYFENTNKFNLVDVDVDSYYPNGIINWRIKAEHLSDAIIDVIEFHTKERVAAKLKGDKTTADIGKIVLNSGVFGKLGFIYSWMFDLKALYKTTINLQLLLLNLIERLELGGINVFSANTDGIVAKVPIGMEKEYKAICAKWGVDFKFGISYTYYSKYVRTSVNSYLAVETNGKVKKKGKIFTTKLRIDKGYFAPAIAKTIEQYYAYGNKDIDAVIRTFTIYDYCISIKVGSQFISELHSIKDNKKHVQILSKTNRYFVSKTGGVFLKHSKEKIKSYTNVIVGRYVTIFNKAYLAQDYNIDYDWYKLKVLETINKINNQNTKDMKKISGSMFDSIDF